MGLSERQLRSRKDSEKRRCFPIGWSYQGPMEDITVRQATNARNTAIFIALNGKGVKFSKNRSKNSPHFAPPKKVGEVRGLLAGIEP